MMVAMALDDGDKQTIAQMIADAVKSGGGGGGGASRPREVPQGDWDQMSSDARRAWVRGEVEEHIRSLDADAERQQLAARNRELEQQIAEAKKSGRRPPKGAGDKNADPEGEQQPTILSKGAQWLFGSRVQ